MQQSQNSRNPKTGVYKEFLVARNGNKSKSDCHDA